MLIVADVRSDKRVPVNESEDRVGLEKLEVCRSEIPAVTHVDHSARVQTVDASRQPRYHRLLERFKALTGCSVLINTSFNIRGEPLVCTPQDAYECFMATQMEVLVIDRFVLRKHQQGEISAKAVARFHSRFDLD